MSVPINLNPRERAGREHLHPNDYWDLNAKWRVESAFITDKLIPQCAADAAKNVPTPPNSDDGLADYTEAEWTGVENEIQQTYCGSKEKEDNTILDMAMHDRFQGASPTAGAVTRLAILFWLAALCELTVFVVQGLFSGGFNPIIILLAAMVGFGGFLAGAGLGRVLYASWHNSFLGEPNPVGKAVWFQVVLGCILIFAVAAFRAYGAGELVPGIFAFMITVLLGALCALFETFHQQAKLKRERCLLLEGQAQTWTAFETHKARLPNYRKLFVNELTQRFGVGGNIKAQKLKAEGVVPLVNTAREA